MDRSALIYLPSILLTIILATVFGSIKVEHRRDDLVVRLLIGALLLFYCNGCNVTLACGFPFSGEIQTIWRGFPASRSAGRIVSNIPVVSLKFSRYWAQNSPFQRIYPAVRPTHFSGSPAPPENGFSKKKKRSEIHQGRFRSKSRVHMQIFALISQPLNKSHHTIDHRPPAQSSA